jgi:3-oxoacyl-[acyl-carrier-protein] synthase II
VTNSRCSQLVVHSFVQISGLGLCTPLGSSAQGTWNALLAGRYLSDHSRALDVQSEGAPRVNQIARKVACEAIASARWSPAQVSNAALIVGTSKGPADAWLGNMSLTSDNLGPAGRSIVLGIADVAGFLAGSLGLHDGPMLTLSAACASGLHALIRGALLIKAGEANRVLVVAAESSLHPLFIQSFRRLGVLPPEGSGCRPFDQNRRGFLMSEAAAAVCLEPVDPDKTGAGSIVLDRFALAGDGTHLTASDAEARTLRRVLSDVIDSRAVDLIHAHGTGTELNDPLELGAIESILPQDDLLPNVYSHKGALGHSLGAAGLISVAINCMSHRQQTIPPNIRTDSPLPTQRIQISREICRRCIHRSIAIASGFGGALAAVSLMSR